MAAPMYGEDERGLCIWVFGGWLEWGEKGMTTRERWGDARGKMGAKSRVQPRRALGKKVEEEDEGVGHRKDDLR